MIKLGQWVKHLESGLVGLVVSQTTHAHGGSSFGVQPVDEKGLDGKRAVVDAPEAALSPATMRVGRRSKGKAARPRASAPKPSAPRAAKPPKAKKADKPKADAPAGGGLDFGRPAAAGR